MNKTETIKYLKRMIAKLNKEFDDDAYCDKIGTLSDIQILQNAILVLIQRG